MLTSRWLVYGYFVGALGNLIDAWATWHARGGSTIVTVSTIVGTTMLVAGLMLTAQQPLLRTREKKITEAERRLREIRDEYAFYCRGIEAARKIVQAMPTTERPS